MFTTPTLLSAKHPLDFPFAPAALPLRYLLQFEYLTNFRGNRRICSMTTKDMVRFFRKVKFDLTTGCWLWTGAIGGNGYGQLKYCGKNCNAHIVAFRHWRGEVPKGLELDHEVCDTRRCANPWHVTPVTHRRNVLRGKGNAAINAVKTHCTHGHPLSGDNLWVQPKTGYRYCRACAKSRSKAFRGKDFLSGL